MVDGGAVSLLLLLLEDDDEELLVSLLSGGRVSLAQRGPWCCSVYWMGVQALLFQLARAQLLCCEPVS